MTVPALAAKKRRERVQLVKVPWPRVSKKGEHPSRGNIEKDERGGSDADVFSSGKIR